MVPIRRVRTASTSCRSHAAHRRARWWRSFTSCAPSAGVSALKTRRRCSLEAGSDTFCASTAQVTAVRLRTHICVECVAVPFLALSWARRRGPRHGAGAFAPGAQAGSPSLRLGKNVEKKRVAWSSSLTTLRETVVMPARRGAAAQARCFFEQERGKSVSAQTASAGRSAAGARRSSKQASARRRRPGGAGARRRWAIA